jgi:hypothetical protein
MAMVKRLWSINALATELDRDRRTVAKALANVPADGSLSGKPAWFLDTALRALRADVDSTRDQDPLLWILVQRLENWRDVRARPHFDVSIESFAKLMCVPERNIVAWLRAGLPYAVEGNWASGRGFVLRPSWVIEWIAAISSRASTPADWRLLRRLCLEPLELCAEVGDGAGEGQCFVEVSDAPTSPPKK